ncbi:MAG: ATPase RavA stimulator ViaA [Flammeovirgaceae bacterium]
MEFKRFEKFGLIADEATRKKVVERIYLRLQNKALEGEKLTNADTNNFADAIDKILSNSTMRELCSKSPELAEKITQEILEFINQTKKKLNKTQSPFEEEFELKEEFKQIKKTEFEDKWAKVKPFLTKIYNNKEFNLDFYEREFRKSLGVKSKNKNIDVEQKNKNEINFESVKEHFIESWEDVLMTKQTKWEIEQIEKERKKFCEELYKKIEELIKLQEVLEPFIQELGRLWDMSKGNWHKVNLDSLKRYAEIMQKDKTLQELAEMLGRMRQAEREYEEELFQNIQLKTEWQIDSASKSDLVAIQESDDLNSLLPSEVVWLADENLQSIFFKKFAEKKLYTFQYQAKMLSYREEKFQDKRQKAKEDSKGPFIICVDTSGSMHGTPEVVAKTLCLAILKIAIRDNRKCYLISFSTSIETLNLADLKNSIDRLISFLSMSFYGGTDAIPAMKEALKMLTTEDYKKADVIMVSDFVMPTLDEEIQKKIEIAKEKGTKFHSLVIGKSQNNAVIKEFDNNWFYDLSNPSSMLTTIKNMEALRNS